MGVVGVTWQAWRYSLGVRPVRAFGVGSRISAEHLAE
jgi:hypothetical protein